MSDDPSAWLPLLRRLTERFPNWLIWKNIDSALAGFGDVDTTAPREDWAAIMSEVCRWAAENDLGPVVACCHPPKTMFLIAIDKTRSTFWELDVLGRKYFRGGTLFRARDLLSLTEIDERGFRRVRPGAEGLILLVQNGLKWGGRPDPEGLAKRSVPQLLRQDPDGVVAAAGVMFGRAEQAAVAAAASVAEGGWNRRAFLRLEAAALLGALREPMIIISRARFRLWTKRKCPVVHSIFKNNRRIPGDVNTWVQTVAANHVLDPVDAARDQ